LVTIWRKLNASGHGEVVVCNAPGSFGPEIAALDDVTIHRAPPKAFTFLLAFVTARREISRLADVIGSKAVGDATIWFAYPKATSKRLTCDFSRDEGWQALGNIGFEGVRQVAIDEDWSAIRFRRVEFIKKLTRDPDRALSDEARRRLKRR
jgi:hypothetical protein